MIIFSIPLAVFFVFFFLLLLFIAPVTQNVPLKDFSVRNEQQKFIFITIHDHHDHHQFGSPHSSTDFFSVNLSQPNEDYCKEAVTEGILKQCKPY